MRPGWLAVGVGLSLLASAVRTRGWLEAVRAANSGGAVRYRDVLAAYFSGAGVNGLLPGRAGDAIKLAALRRRTPELPYSTLAATLAPPALVESAFSAALLAWALASGLFPLALLRQGSDLFGDRLPLLLAGLAAVALLACLAVRRLPQLAARLRRGFAIMGSPSRLVTGVVLWQLAARAIRLLAIAALLAAFSLPLAPATAALVMVVQGATPSLGAATTPLRALTLAYSFPHAAGQHISIAHAAEFLVGTQLALALANLALALAIVALGLRSISPRAWPRELHQVVAALRPAPRRTPA